MEPIRLILFITFDFKWNEYRNVIVFECLFIRNESFVYTVKRFKNSLNLIKVYRFVPSFAKTEQIR